MIKAIRRSQLPPDSDDDGGMSDDNNFPIIDLPPGDKLEDILVDRWHEDTLHARIRIKKH